MKQYTAKLIMTSLGLLVSLVLLSVGTFAWFAISKTATISGVTLSIAAANESLPFEISIDGENWTTTLDISNVFSDDTVLRPISTYDGENWFVATYDANGSVNDFSLLTSDEVNIYSNNGNSENNYYVYTDIYIRTSNESQEYFSLVLSNPSSLDSVQEQETNFGTFVLYEPLIDDDDNLITNDAMASLRIGFQVYDQVDADTSVTLIEEDAVTEYEEEGPFYIYEPNADMRSQDFSSYNDLSTESTLSNLAYIYSESGDIYTVNYNEIGEGVQTTVVPQIAEDESFELATVGSDTDETVLIQQYTSSWDLSELAQGFDSNSLSEIGDFVSDTPEMTTVSVGEVKKIRIYFWLEGQDIDCWNQIAGGNIYANLEFTSGN